MVVISSNEDLGDAWKFADAPHYPEQAASIATRIGVNDIVLYAMTH